ncbi:hypothetical protein EJ03DRAFT_353308 [Teratosphaeria nubilosa]|uniref:Uncharacterized protein n=1 Tax=Teratosphaeria nubilosa TaxID=161662 RepID=A0A6G1L2I3_9PEZI|nr:hypothetical protein EJ03DRAFT_353308 [Teratosphaeria nubilosa]
MAPKTKSTKRAKAGTSKATSKPKAATKSTAASKKAASTTGPPKPDQKAANPTAAEDDGDEAFRPSPPKPAGASASSRTKRKRKAEDQHEDHEEPPPPPAKRTRQTAKRERAEHEAPTRPSRTRGQKRQAENADAPAPAAPSEPNPHTTTDDDPAPSDPNLALPPIPTILAEFSPPTPHPCTFANAPASLTATLQIHPDHDALLPPTQCFRLGYRARFYLSRHNDKTTKKEEIGHIEAYRVSIPPAAARRNDDEDDDEPWLSLLVRPAIKDVREEFRECAKCLHALFSRAAGRKNFGTPKATVPPHAAAALATNEGGGGSLLYIQSVFVAPRFQRQGLLPHVMGVWEGLVRGGGLPVWFRFREGAMVLVPGRLADGRGDMWGGVGEEVVEGVLGRAYGRCGFGVFVGGVVGGGDERITVLGRVLGGVRVGRGRDMGCFCLGA